MNNLNEFLEENQCIKYSLFLILGAWIIKIGDKFGYYKANNTIKLRSLVKNVKFIITHKKRIP